MKSSYFSGELSSVHEYSVARFLRRNMVRKLIGDTFGHWYDPKDFFRWKSQGFDVRVFGSLFYPYRFSIALVKR